MHHKEELEGFCDGFSGTILGVKCVRIIQALLSI
jgi:hypothetical protein